MTIAKIKKLILVEKVPKPTPTDPDKTEFLIHIGQTSEMILHADRIDYQTGYMWTYLDESPMHTAQINMRNSKLAIRDYSKGMPDCEAMNIWTSSD